MSELQKAAPSRGSSIVANVLLFVGVLLVFLVFTRAWNEGKPKEASMFGGGGGESALPAGQLSKPPEAAASAPSGAVHGTISIAPGLPGAGVVFVTLRPSGAPDRGPPTAVRRLEARFPLDFSIGPEHVMLAGQPFVGPFDLYARVDRDGDPLTKDPQDPALGPIKGVQPGGPSLALAFGEAGTPASAPPPASPASAGAAAGGPLRGRISIAPALGAASGAALYVIVRGAGSPDRGPPVAVRKYERPSFPLAFEVGPEHMMMEGTSFVGPFDVWARLDGDGDAASRNPGDLEPSAPVAKVMPGASGLELVLDRRR